MHFIRSVAIASTLLAFSSLVSAGIATHVDSIKGLIAEASQIPKLSDALKVAENWTALIKMPKQDLTAFKALYAGIAKLTAVGGIYSDVAGRSDDVTEPLGEALEAACKAFNSRATRVTGTGGDEVIKACTEANLIADVKLIDEIFKTIKGATAKTYIEVKKDTATFATELAALLKNNLDPKKFEAADQDKIERIKLACSGESPWETWQYIALIVAIVLLLAIIGAVIYFFVVKRK
jgi:hypothetical protein